MEVLALVEFSMRGRLLTTGCVAAAALAVVHAQQQPPTFGTTMRTVAVYATVTDPQGRLAPTSRATTSKSTTTASSSS